MIADSRLQPEAWREWAVPGAVIQIRAERNLLFLPQVVTRAFWVYLQENPATVPAVGPATALLHSAVVRCRRLFPRRGLNPRIPLLEYHADEIEKATGRLLRDFREAEPLILDLGFPMLVDLLEKCPEALKARAGDVVELELAPPLLAYLL